MASTSRLCPWPSASHAHSEKTSRTSFCGMKTPRRGRPPSGSSGPQTFRIARNVIQWEHIGSNYKQDCRALVLELSSWRVRTRYDKATELPEPAQWAGGLNDGAHPAGHARPDWPCSGCRVGLLAPGSLPDGSSGSRIRIGYGGLQIVQPDVRLRRHLRRHFYSMSFHSYVATYHQRSEERRVGKE